MAPFDTVCRRAKPPLGREAETSPTSLMAAVNAATLAAPLFIDFRRVTRLFECKGPGPRRRDCEPARAWDCLEDRLPEVGVVEEREGRWVNGRELCWISCT